MHPKGTFLGSCQPGQEANLTRFQMSSYRSSWERPASATPYFLPEEKNLSQKPKKTGFFLRMVRNKRPWTTQDLSYPLVI